jgi:membrane protein required for colicin V production
MFYGGVYGMGILLDALLSIILLMSVIAGLRHGFIRSLTELVGSIAAVAVSIIFSYKVADLIHPFLSEHLGSLHGFVPQDVFERAVAVVLIYISVEIIIRIVSSILGAVFKLPVLRQLNAVFGGAFGLLKGAVIVLLVCSFMQFFLPMYKKNTQKGKIDWQQLGTSRIYKYTVKSNPVYDMFNNDIWHKVGKNESKK